MDFFRKKYVLSFRSAPFVILAKLTNNTSSTYLPFKHMDYVF